MDRFRKYQCPCGRVFTVKAGFFGQLECRACGRVFLSGLGGPPRPFNKSREAERYKRQQEKQEGGAAGGEATPEGGEAVRDYR